MVDYSHTCRKHSSTLGGLKSAFVGKEQFVQGSANVPEKSLELKKKVLKRSEL